MSYPAWKYHSSKEPVLVKSVDDEGSLGLGWGDHPDGPFSEESADVEPKKRTRKAKGANAESEE